MFGSATYFAASASKGEDYTEDRRTPLPRMAPRTLLVDELRGGVRLLPVMLVESHTQGKYQVLSGCWHKEMRLEYIVATDTIDDGSEGVYGGR